MRCTISAQIDPAVAAAVKRVDDDWLIVVNPHLPAVDRDFAAREAHCFIDCFLSGQTFVAPANGYLVVECDALADVAS